MKCRSNLAASLFSFALFLWNCKESHQLYIQNITATSTSVTIEWYFYYPYNFTVACTCTDVWCSVQPAEESVLEAFNVTIDDLHPYTNYSCCVSDNLYGFLDCGGVQTSQAAPSAAPQITSAMPNSARSISLQWGEVPEGYRNGPITSYVVRIVNIVNGATHLRTTTNGHRTVYGLDSQPPYRCSVAATTDAGTGPYSTEIEVHIAPYSAPRNLNTARTSTTFSISWDPPAAEDFTGYIGEYRLSFRNIGTGYEWTASTSNQHFTVDSLQPYRSYSYSVAAVTYAVGPYTTTQSIQTLEDSPARAPQLMTAVPNSPSSILLEWTEVPLADRNGIIVGYMVRIKEIPSLRITTTTHTSSISYIVAELDHRTPYNCSVAASTSAGTGPFGEEHQVHIAPYSAPQNVLVNSTSHTLTISWGAPRSEDYTGSIQQYRVNITDAETNQMWESFTSDTNFTAYRLHPYRTYNCTIAAETYAPGPYSDTVSEQTDETAPTDSPRNLSYINVTENSVFLSWEAPFKDSQNGIITHYVVKLHTLQSPTLPTYTNASDTRLIIESLERRTEYEFCVAASTRVGTGPYSDSILVKTTGELIPIEIILAVVFAMVTVVVIGAIVLTIYGIIKYKKKHKTHAPAVAKGNYYIDSNIDSKFASEELELKPPSKSQLKPPSMPRLKPPSKSQLKPPSVPRLKPSSIPQLKPPSMPQQTSSFHKTLDKTEADNESDGPRSHYSSSYYSSSDAESESDHSIASQQSPPTTPPLPIPKRSPICKRLANHDEDDDLDDSADSIYVPTSDEETFDINFYREKSIASQSSFGTPPPIPTRSPVRKLNSANHDEQKDSEQTESIYQPLIPLLMMNKDGVPLLNFPVNETNSPDYNPLVSVVVLGDQKSGNDTNEYAALTHSGRAPPQTQPKKEENPYQPLLLGRERLQGKYEMVTLKPGVKQTEETPVYEPIPFDGGKAINTQPSSEVFELSNKKRAADRYPTHSHVVLRKEYNKKY